MTELQNKLISLSDSTYRDFQAKLVPTADKSTMLGVRVPVLRKFAVDFSKTEECEKFLHTLPHDYYDENMLHSILLCNIKDYNECISLIDEFLPFTDNWAVCDVLSPKVFKKHKPELLMKIKEWISSEETYTVRFGLEMLMAHFLDSDFSAEQLQLACSVKSDEYYVKMMVAWYFATALSKQWSSAVSYIESKALEPWTHNKAIQKAVESLRITSEQKTYLKSLKIK